PKNVNFLKYIFGLVQGNDFIAMDFFAGSGSSLQAIQELNVDDNGKRQFIAVQREELCKVDSSALEAGYTSIFEITKDRILKSSQKIIQNFPNYKGDLGFKIFETVDDFRVKDDEKELTLSNLTMFDDVLLNDEQYSTLLTTWVLYDGSELTSPIYDIDLNGYTAHLCDRRLYMISPDFNSDALKALLQKLDNTEDKDFDPNKIVYYANNFDSMRQMELNDALKSYANKKSIEIDVVVRN
ncbi:site-specific DNA-methyltransferase, partial [Acinetobacter baumannii]|nr:site-specific DNA-methyltransferase [Acinetobacter baumannii]